MPQADSLASAFADAVTTHRAREALVWDAGTLTYAELGDIVSATAAHLRDIGVGRGDLVAICMERGLNPIVVLLAVIATGAAFMPIDLEFPPMRRHEILEASAARAIIVDDAAELLGCVPETCAGLVWEETTQVIRIDSPAPSVGQVLPAEVAYVMYTSGTSGRPKGVMVPHSAALNLVATCDFAGLGPGTVVAQASSLAFDASAFEVWGALLTGSTLVILRSRLVSSHAPQLVAAAGGRRTVLFLTTAVFQQIARRSPESLAQVDCVVFGGESCDPLTVGGFLRSGFSGDLVQVYGPTETTTFATIGVLDPTASLADLERVPVGMPLSGVTISIVDGDLVEKEIGTVGEVLIGGRGVALGYLNDPELTSARFVSRRVDGSGEVVYRSGDLGRLIDDGQLEILGRADAQVKIRGHRIEPEGIRSILCRHRDVREAVVIVRDDLGDELRIVAYVVAPSTGIDELRAFLADRLPKYSIPHHFVSLDGLPLASTGKVDMSRLPRPARPGERVHG